MKRPASSTTLPVSIPPTEEHAPLDALTKYAFEQARANYVRELQSIADMAGEASGHRAADGWRLDLDRLRWYRPVPKQPQ